MEHPRRVGKFNTVMPAEIPSTALTPVIVVPGFAVRGGILEDSAGVQIEELGDVEREGHRALGHRTHEGCLVPGWQSSRRGRTLHSIPA